VAAASGSGEQSPMLLALLLRGEGVRMEYLPRRIG
jgi:hypothetical protein